MESRPDFAHHSELMNRVMQGEIDLVREEAMEDVEAGGLADRPSEDAAEVVELEEAPSGRGHRARWKVVLAKVGRYLGDALDRCLVLCAAMAALAAAKVAIKLVAG